MSFDLYFAGSQNRASDEAMFKIKCCKLYSQLNDRKRGELWLQHNKEHNDIKVFVDSGAFSAWSKGKTIDVDDYIDYINQNSYNLLKNPLNY